MMMTRKRNVRLLTLAFHGPQFRTSAASRPARRATSEIGKSSGVSCLEISISDGTGSYEVRLWGFLRVSPRMQF